MVFARFGPKYNEPAAGDAPTAPREPLPAGPTLVWVALSGGGTRAAALGWFVLQALRTVPFVDRFGAPSNLAAEIDYISGISGGSFAASAWCRFGPDDPRFEEKFLHRNIQLAPAGEGVKPWKAIRLPLRNVSRTNLAAEMYDRTVFDGARFADLPARPELRVHATNLALGDRFSFTPRDFEQIGSDLDAYPLGHACAASSAFPVLLSPLSLRNHGTQQTPTEMVETDQRYAFACNNADDDLDWYFRKLAREYYNDKSNQFVHLADGGLVDNQGLQAILDEFDVFGAINARLNSHDAPLERLVIINVNAGTRTDDAAGQRARAPGAVRVMLYTMVTSMDLLSAKRWVRIREQADNRRRAGLRAARAGIDSPLAGLEIHTVEISFRKVLDDALRAACQELPTSFHLTHDQLDVVARAAEALVRDDSDLAELQHDMDLP